MRRLAYRRGHPRGWLWSSLIVTAQAVPVAGSLIVGPQAVALLPQGFTHSGVPPENVVIRPSNTIVPAFQIGTQAPSWVRSTVVPADVVQVTPPFGSSIFVQTRDRPPPFVQQGFFRAGVPAVDVAPPAIEFADHGWYDQQGWYHHTVPTSCEPYVSAKSENAQVVPNAVLTTLNIAGISSHTPGLPTFDADPWGMIDAANDRIVFSHEGIYSIQVWGSWANNAVGVRRFKMTLFDQFGVALRTVFEDDRPAAFISGIACAPDIQPVRAGWYIAVEVFQSSGGDLEVNDFFISAHRIATFTPTL